MRRILFHKYEFIKKIGDGGTCTVFLAKDLHLGRLAAVKESKGDMGTSEVELMKELEHPGIPRIYDYVKEHGKDYLVMEYIEGITMREFLNKNGKVPVEQAAAWAVQLCSILSYLHSRGTAIIYRDLKPENIMVRPDGQVKLIDLGASIRYVCGHKKELLCMGTPGYCPKQQLKDAGGNKTWDVFGLGAVLHEMLTGVNPTLPPYVRVPLREFDKSLPRGLEKIIDCCTSEKESERFQSMEQLTEALLQYEKYGRRGGMLWNIKKIIPIPLYVGMAVELGYPLVRGIERSQIPFPYLEKPLFFLLGALMLQLLTHRRKENKYLQRVEKGIWLSEKKFMGLYCAVLFVSSCILSGACRETVYMRTAYAQESAQSLWVEMRDNEGRKMLLKDDAVYETGSCVKFEIPADRLPEGEFTLYLIATKEGGEVYSSREFLIKVTQNEEGKF